MMFGMTDLSPTSDNGVLADLTLGKTADLRTRSTPATSRKVFAAVHVVADPLRAAIPVTSNHIDWETTLQLRHRIWDLGLGVAESMDTAQRGMGLSAADAMTLAQRSLTEDPRGGAGVVVGIGTDALDPAVIPTLTDIGDAYLAQLEIVEAGGGTAVLMASRHLARIARTPEDYLAVYERVIGASQRIVLHWLGEVFDPALRGYWGTTDTFRALDTVTGLITAHAEKVEGIKISLLDPIYELRLRSLLPDGVALFTGDDFNYVDMIAGDGQSYSHALLGAFAILAPFASAAFARLDENDEAGFRAILKPTEPLSRLVFESPTPYYKVGVAWISYLSGFQSHFRMLGGLESGRSLSHLAQVLRVAGEIGLFPDPDFTRQRARAYFAAQGVA
jgi:hypothetical protein